MKYILPIVGLITLIIAIFAAIQFFSVNQTDIEDLEETLITELEDNTTQNELDTDDEDISEIQESANQRTREEVIGTSVSGNDIIAYNFGSGEETILLVGGIHGGFSYNTAALGFEMVDYLASIENSIPENLTVTVVPVLNPDGLEKVTSTTGRFNPSTISVSESDRVAARFNANNVDLNRNFDCNWQSEGMWRNQTVSGGSGVFSEPEARAIQGLVQAHIPTAVVAWFAAAGEVYASSCNGTPSSRTQTLLNTYAAASGYNAQDAFDAYPVTGDMLDWLADNNIPAISVLLSNHTSTELERNKQALQAVLNLYGN